MERLEDSIPKCKELMTDGKQCIVVCRRGNDSQLAVQKLRASGIVQSYDIIGGLLNIAQTIDKDMPIF
jgi:adenylyltransferase/sulfurtransferase